MIVLQYAVDAVALGSLYALTALGIGLTFGVMRLINFAHGDFVMAGGYALTVPSTAIAATLFIGNWPWPVMIIAILLIVMLIALLTERIAFRPLRGSSPATLLISSFAVSFALQQVVRFVWNSDAKGIGVGNALNKAINIGALRITGLDIITMAITLVLLVSLVFFLKYTRYGVQIRAASEDFEMARLLGVKANTVIAIAFALSGALAGVVALLFVIRIGVLSPAMGVRLVLFAFVATVLGGMGSLTGAVAGGFLIGIMSVALQAGLPLELRGVRDAFVFSIIIAILIARPNGLFRGRAAMERV